MSCISGIAKYLLFLFNFLIVVCGIVLIAVGAIILVNENKGIDSFTDFSVGGFAIAVGVIIFLISFLGCCGAIKENSCMLTTYAVILILLLVLQVVLGAMAFVTINKDNLEDEVEKVVEKVFDKYQDNNDTKKIVDEFQQEFECCGVENSSYWTSIPASCHVGNKLSGKQYEDGCAEKFKDALVSSIKIIGGVAIGFAVVELVGAIFAFCVRNR